MTAHSSAIYAGQVVHKRLSPKQHGFAYKVFSFCNDRTGALAATVDEVSNTQPTMRRTPDA